VRASHTATFIALKPGLLTLDGPDHCGQVEVHDIGLPVDDFPAVGRTVALDLFADCLRPRPRNSHKGSWGDVGVVGGAAGMVGAAMLAGRAALRLGAGRLFVGLLVPEALAVDSIQPELMLRPARQVVDVASVLAVGPGLGQSAEAHDLLAGALRRPVPLVLDADALNLLAAHPVLAGRCARRDALVVVTPHPAEAARLLGTTTAQVQADRVAAAGELARRLNCVAVLKGCGSVVAAPEGRWFINGTGNPGMASAGMGDVLTGLVAALLAQGWPPQSALLAAVHLHGAAGDLLAERGDGPVGLAAAELIDPARRLLNEWIAAAGKISSM
jgi:ADP-dependent NAD(P)H-hydrate dehydratase / NAD(P)H-hydrate epimerase